MKQKKLQPYKLLEPNASGTVVLWENFDRLEQESSNAQAAFDENIQKAREHVALVFHRFIKGEAGLKPVSIFFNGDRVKAVDPFLTSHTATQPLTEQKLQINGEEILIKPYVLPFPGKLTSKDIQNIGSIDSLRLNQGFYIYRNRRLIIWGTWFRMTPRSEIKKLARIRVDIPNTLDSLWDIDIKKSRASLPQLIRENLRNIVNKSIERSDGVYKHRGTKFRKDDLTHIWEAMDERGAFKCRINKTHPLYKMLEDVLDEQHLNLLENFVRLLEESFPYAECYYHIANNESKMDPPAGNDDEMYDLAEQFIHSFLSGGAPLPQIIKDIENMDLFAKYPEMLAKIREKYGNDGKSE